jgi:hypothetical protein
MFVVIEFAFAATVCVALALLVAVAAVIRGNGWWLSVIGFVFFGGVAVNSLAVTMWVKNHVDDARDRSASVRDLGTFAAETLVPGALLFALRSPPS